MKPGQMTVMKKVNVMIAAQVATVCGLIALTGCAELRRVTYPNDFVWLSKGDVQTVMESLSKSLKTIDETVLVAPPGSRDIIRAELSQMITTAESIAAERRNGAESQLVTNHLLIDEHLDQFIADLNYTKLQIENNPAQNSEYLLGRLTGNCNACHQYRQ